MPTGLRSAQRPQRTGRRCQIEWIVRPGRFESQGLPMAATSMRSSPGLIAAEAPEPTFEPVPQDADSAAWVAAAFEAALRARAPGVYASTPLVCQLARRVGRELGLDSQAEALLEV